MPKKTRDCFTIGYLLCRAGDTIADTTLISMEKRLELIKLFPMLIEKQEKATIDIFTSLIYKNLLLLIFCSLIFQVFAEG